VIDSRVRADGTRTRRRKCGGCGAKWSTMEVDFELGRTIKKLIIHVGAMRATMNEMQTLLDKLADNPIVANLDEDDGG
jgi:transcriptional regulator NrdR family protein